MRFANGLAPAHLLVVMLLRVQEVVPELAGLSERVVDVEAISGRECYYKRAIDGGSRVYFRKPDDHADRVLLDMDATAAGWFRYYHVYAFVVKPDVVEVDERRA